MFAIIELKGATHLVINVPVVSAEKSLPALIGMLEQNTVCFNKSWRETTTVKPEMSIILGETYRLENDGVEFVINESHVPHVVGEGFELATPNVFISNSKQRTAFEEKIKKLEAEVSFQKAVVQKMQDEVSFQKAVVQKMQDELSALANPEVPTSKID